MGICYGKSAKCAHASSNQFMETTSSLSDKRQDSSSSNKKSVSLSFNKTVVAPEGEISVSNRLRAFSYNDLKNAAKNFRSDSLLGEGGFGWVYKAWLDENSFAASKPGSGISVAIKKLKTGSCQGHREWLTEVNYLGQLHHKNLVKLIGYCVESDNRLLVYEFMSKGSLENHLFRRGVQPIPWATRIHIATDVARGISFLHNLDSNVIYRDLKASNILLDSDFNAKLSDFGYARAGPTGDRTHVSTRVVGTKGYAAPEYVATGRLTTKSDVYSFGVVLLELLSGRRALGDERAGGVDEETLVDWAKPLLGDKRVLRIMDTRMGGQYPKKEAQAVASLAYQCLDFDPKLRPSMLDVVGKLEQIPLAKNVSRTLQVKQEHNGKTRTTSSK